MHWFSLERGFFFSLKGGHTNNPYDDDDPCMNNSTIWLIVYALRYVLQCIKRM